MYILIPKAFHYPVWVKLEMYEFKKKKEENERIDVFRESQRSSTTFTRT